MTDQISIVWGVDDVLETARTCNVKLSKDQAREVLQLLERRHDATIGINWDVIRETIYMYLEEND